MRSEMLTPEPCDEGEERDWREGSGEEENQQGDRKEDAVVVGRAARRTGWRGREATRKEKEAL